ncbi:hypothetical protein K503DRAFT_768939 [Rhizopogon vinicolor AM-OR11-026]|uniref:DUF6533 domain-containing protein n=1 Tax=Rhizopogon vinicolor AM-OR11-026 TaxID=1314800 RepID=A0A1B7N583_9AGAM|nr:hypothetical protein K503DRAFT_768939 [Rhizopogon vinicolor AM-OR11-026]
MPYSNFDAVASLTMLVYDYALSFGKEVDLIWRQRWSLMTLLYISVRYVGIPSTIVLMTGALPVVSMTDMSCTFVSQIYAWVGFVINTMLGVILITRLHAMYQQPRRMLIFLIVTFLAVTIACRVINAIVSSSFSGEELVLSGNHYCIISGNYEARLTFDTWILGTVWEALALCLTAWIAIKHIRELQQSPPGSAIGDCLTVLIKSHIFYFAGFTIVDCFSLVTNLSPYLLNSLAFNDVLQIGTSVQMFILGPRLILSVRDYNATLVENSDAATRMSSIAFQARVPESTGDA